MGTAEAPLEARNRGARPPGLIQGEREGRQDRHDAPPAVATQAQCLRRCLRGQQRRHPRQMGSAAVKGCLTHLAVTGEVRACSRNQAHPALLVLYRELLGRDLDPEGVSQAGRVCGGEW